MIGTIKQHLQPKSLKLCACRSAVDITALGTQYDTREIYQASAVVAVAFDGKKVRGDSRLVIRAYAATAGTAPHYRHAVLSQQATDASAPPPPQPAFSSTIALVRQTQTSGAATAAEVSVHDDKCVMYALMQ